MQECQMAMESYTQASRARQILKRSGIISEIRRTEHLGRQGCGYVLAVQGDCDHSMALLQQAGVAVSRLSSQAGDGW